MNNDKAKKAQKCLTNALIEAIHHNLYNINDTTRQEIDYKATIEHKPYLLTFTGNEEKKGDTRSHPRKESGSKTPQAKQEQSRDEAVEAAEVPIFRTCEKKIYRNIKGIIKKRVTKKIISSCSKRPEKIP